MGHSLVIAVQILANVCPFMEMWNKVLKRLEMFLDSHLLAKSTWYVFFIVRCFRDCSLKYNYLKVNPADLSGTNFWVNMVESELFNTLQIMYWSDTACAGIIWVSWVILMIEGPENIEDAYYEVQWCLT